MRLIAFAAESRRVQPGDVLFRRGEPSDGAYVVMSGGVTLEGDPAGPVEAGRATLLGELALLTDTERPLTAVASAPGHVLKITRPVFRRVLEEYPAAAEALREMIARRMDETVARLGQIGDSLDAIGG
nr:cyclic nucleotide-binding domain-containing protein [Alsobacter ponti]